MDEDQSAKYEACARRMWAAGTAYMRAHPFAQPVFRFDAFESEMAERAGQKIAPGERVAVAASLGPIIDQIAGNADARALLRAMDEAVEGEGTYMQVRAIIDIQIEANLKRSQGQITAPGDWHCPGCGALCDGFTAVDGHGGKPAPGSFLLCAYCAQINCVTRDGFREVGKKELHALPTWARKQLFAARSACEAAIAKRKGQS